MKLHYSNIENVLVTGGAGGIGSCVVQQLLDQNFRVIVIDNDTSALAELREKTKEKEAYLHLCNFDLENVEGLEIFLRQEVVGKHRISAFIHCAGIQEEKDFFEIGLRDWRRVYAINLESCFVLSRLIGQEMVQQKIEGAMIFITSIHSKIIRNIPQYSSAKAALDMLAKEFCYQMAPHKIRVNTVAPGSVETSMLNGLLTNKELLTKAINRVPLGRLGQPNEIAHLVLFLLSDESKYITGANIVIDGGLSLVI